MSTESEQQQKQFLREKIKELASKSYTQREIASICKVSVSTVNSHIKILREQAKNSISEYVDKILPYEYSKCLVGIDGIIKTCWRRSELITNNEKEKFMYLTLAKEGYSMKLELLNSSTIVEKAIKFVDKGRGLIHQNGNPVIDHKQKHEGTKEETNVSTKLE
jgi:hypothetical protein